MDKLAYSEGLIEGLEKASSVLDKVLSSGVNYLSQAARARVCEKLPSGPVKSKILKGEPLSPFLVKQLREQLNEY